MQAKTKVITQKTKNSRHCEETKTTRQSLSHEEDCFVPRNDVVIKHYDVAIVGAGPAGIMAAIWAAKGGARVVLLEKNEQIGRKILATGNGRCNITNRSIEISRYHGSDVSFAKSILENFDTIKYFETLGLKLKEEDRGRMFPVSDKAGDVVELLSEELRGLGVETNTGFTVKKVEPGHLWRITDEKNQLITADKLILTTGGKAAHGFGSSGDGLFWAKNLGHTISPIHAALVPIETEQAFVKEIMGIKLKVRATLLADNKQIISREGDLLFTHYGVSGPAAMGLAREIDPLLHSGKKVEISIDLLPEKTEESLNNAITNLVATDGKKSIKNVISDFLPKNLSPIVLQLTEVNPDIKAAEISRKQRGEIISRIKDFSLIIKKVRPLKEAQVMAGGILTTEVKPNLESKIIPNLYFAGEILDIDADSGGFNLQWAWASGKVAGESASE